MQTILGPNGAIATQLSKYLTDYTKQIRQVSRHPKKVNAADELVSADFLNYQQTERSVAKSEVLSRLHFSFMQVWTCYGCCFALNQNGSNYIVNFDV